MSAGQLRQRITILSSSKEPDGTGADVTTWSAIADTPTVYARVEIKQSSPEFNGDKVEYKTNYEITIRYRSDIEERQRIEFNGRQLKIVGIDEPERRDYLKINCQHLDG